MAVRGSQNTTNANIESRTAPARSFGYLGRVKTRGAVITPGPALCRLPSVLASHERRHKLWGCDFLEDLKFRAANWP